MTLVAVHGSYFANNFGDTLLVRLMCDRVADRVGKDNVVLAVPGDEREQLAIGYPVATREQRAAVDHLVFAGGGYFGEPAGSWRERRRWYRRNGARHLDWVPDFGGAIVHVLGVGYGPLTGRRFRARVDALLGRAQTVLLRDEESIGYYAGDADQCVDLALSMRSAVKPRDKRAIGLHLYNLDDQHRQSLIALAVQRYPDRELLLLNDSKRDNYESPAVVAQIAALRADGRAVEVLKYTDVDTLVSHLDRCEVVVTSKLHVGIVSIALGAASLSIPFHQKVTRLYRQLGISEYCEPYTGADPTDAVARMMDSVAGYRPDRAVIDAGVAQVDEALDAIR